MTALLEALERDGFVVLRGLGAYVRFEAVARELGETMWTTDVRLAPEVKTYLCQPEAVPLHTDHPDVNVVGWWCEEQDAVDGASLLVDTRDVLAAMGAEREQLRAVELPCPPLGRLARSHGSGIHPLLSGKADVYFAAWLARTEAPTTTFRTLVERREPHRVRLAKGDALFIKNRRLLHGREALAPGSRRRLRRLWLGAAIR